MENVPEALAFVNGQVEFHTAKAATLGDTAPRRTAQHVKFSQQFAALAAFIERQAAHVDKLEDELARRPPAPPPLMTVQLSLRLEDIDGLPDELMQELSITDGDKADFAIQALMQEHGGVMSRDQLLIGLYRKTREIHKRANLNARVYRLTKKGTLYDVPGRRGVYSTRPLTDSEAAALDRGSGAASDPIS